MRRKRRRFSRKRVRFGRTSDGMRFGGREKHQSRRSRRKARRRASFHLDAIEPLITTIESGGTSTSTTGQCSYSVVLAPNSGADFNTLTDNSKNVNVTNPLTTANVKIYYKCWARTEIINQSLLPTTITFYTCKPRYNITQSIWSPLTTGMVNLGTFPGTATAGVNIPQIANTQTTANYGTTGSYLGYAFSALGYQEFGTAPYAGLHQVPSLSPFDAPLFTRMFKITSVKQACVNAGKCFTLTSSRPYKRYDPMTMNPRGDQPAGCIAYKGEPIVIMKLVGGPVTDTSQLTMATLAPTRVGYVCMRKYSCKFVQQALRRVTALQVLPTGFAGTAEYVSFPASAAQTSTSL